MSKIWEKYEKNMRKIREKYGKNMRTNMRTNMSKNISPNLITRTLDCCILTILLWQNSSLMFPLGFNDASLPSHRWTDYWPPSEIIVSDYWSSQKTSQINRSRWLRKIIAAMVMFTLKTPQNLKDPSKIPQNLQKPTQNLQNYGKKPKTSKNPQKLPKTSKLYKHR